MIQTNQYTRQDEERVRQFDYGEAPQVARVYKMGDNAEKRQGEWKSINEEQEDLNDNDAGD